MDLYHYFNTAIIFYKELTFQKKYINEQIKPYLNYLEEKHKGNFTDFQRHKILNYYCLYIPSVVCFSYKKLLGQSFTESDRIAASKMGLITPIYDDLFDELKLDSKQIELLTNNPDSFESDIFLTKIVKEVLIDLIDTSYDKAAFQKVNSEMFKIQIDSMEQFNPAISKSELYRITWTKGMLSWVFYYTHLFGNPDEKMNEIFYEYGGLSQLCNDIFDIYKDCRVKNYTLANTCTDFNEMKLLYLQKVRIINNKINELTYPNSKKNYFKLVILALIASTMVAIDYHIQTEKKKGKNINWFELERSLLVIDMSKPKNMFKLLYNIWKLAAIK